jgi:spermidine synthase
MRAPYAAVLLLSAATIVFEIALTRVFSVAQWYHFAFMTVSLALLGFGASGSFLALFPRMVKRDLNTLLFNLCLLCATSILCGYLVSNHVPFDSYQIVYDRRQLLYLAVYYLSLSVPFFFSGLAVAVLLAAAPERAGRVYFANLMGSGIGCPVTLVLLALTGGEATVILASLLGVLASLVLACRQSWARFAVGLALAVILAWGALWLPSCFEIRMSPYKALSNTLRYPGAEIVYRGWTAFARVDVVESEGIRSAPGLSYVHASGLPDQIGIFTDGEDLSPLTTASSGADLSFLDSLLVSLPYRLASRPRVLILEPGAGLDVLLAVHNDASEIVAVDSNPLVLEIVKDRYDDYAGGLYRRDEVALVGKDGRSYLRRSQEKFDIIQVSLAEGYRPVGSGAYSLSENYLYTTEAFVEYLSHLTPEGTLVVHRWLQTPPSESVRILSLALSALERVGVENPGRHVIALRSLYTGMLLVGREGFTSEQIDGVRRFSEEKRFDLVYYPGITPEEVNRFCVLEEPYYYDAYTELLDAADRETFYAAYPFDVTPPSDDRPFFFHFFRWRQTPEIIRSLGRTWQPFGGSGYLVLMALLLLAVLASAILVMLPLFFVKSEGQRGHGKRLFFYFLLLGLAYLFVEIPLIQRFILFLGHPVYAFATVLFSLLFFSGAGSLLSPRLPLRKAMLALIGLLVCYPILLPYLFQWLLGLPFAYRLVAAVMALAPLGFLMGVPFPSGIRLTGRLAPGLVPWAWGVNGCASVLSSILAVMLAISHGFSRVLFAGGVAYALALIVIYTLAVQQPGGGAEAGSAHGVGQTGGN